MFRETLIYCVGMRIGDSISGPLDYADMAKLADALDLGSSGATHAGSSPVIRRGEAP